MIKYDILNDLSILTTIPILNLNKLSTRSCEDMCHCVLESINSNEQVSSLDIGIGQIVVFVDDEQIKYKFLPSSEFEQMLIDSINSNKSPLTNTIEQSLQKRMINIYKELL